MTYFFLIETLLIDNVLRRRTCTKMRSCARRVPSSRCGGAVSSLCPQTRTWSPGGRSRRTRARRIYLTRRSTRWKVFLPFSYVLYSSVMDPDPQDPHVSGPPGSGSISQRYGSGSGSFPFLSRCWVGYNDFDFFLTKWSLPGQWWVPN